MCGILKKLNSRNSYVKAIEKVFNKVKNEHSHAATLQS